MKKYFEVIGFIVLAMFSFFYTSKTSIVVKNMDDIMVRIKEEKENNITNPISATVEDDTIIPGISGKEVDVNASYDAMKKVGTYNEKLLVYRKIKPSISILDSYDKFIIKGNPNKNEVTLIFKVDEKDDISKVIEILDKNEIKANIFTEDNLSNDILNLVTKGYNVGSINNKTWLNTVVTKVANQKYSYCYIEEKDKEILSICDMNKSYTILPNIITTSTPTLTIKKMLEPGSIISIEVNKTAIKELEFIIRYIKSKGYNIVNLETLLEE
ncbi:MAG: hypothetical protein IJ565_04955 [Bacilli bacterium]|nr:hypothetical protein [Bacilli bacterium]